MTHPIPLPPVYEAVLDGEGLDRLFADLARDVVSVEVTVRARARDLVPEGQAPVGLPEARTLLASEAPPALQLRYRFGDEVWLDTLLPVPAGVRLVRIALPR